ncbi:MAG: DUF1365 domain-containing protein [Pseudomonadota bacterium]
MAAEPLRSALYEGWVRHERLSGRGHRFQYRVFMAYLDLDELDALEARVSGFSHRQRAPVRFRRDDHAGADAPSLADWARDTVAAAGIPRPAGAVRLLTNLRYLGHCFNPLSVYYCFDRSERLSAAVLEVTNTPWGERHCYVLGGATRQSFAKGFHVSPFMSMDMRYRAYLPAPGRLLRLALANGHGDETVHRATVLLQIRPFNSRTLWRCVLGYPWLTLRIKLAIHWQALMLWCKGYRVHPHPKHAAGTDS